MTEGAQQSANGKYEAGDIVDVKGHGRATVLELGEPSGPHAGRVLVRYHEDDTTYWCNPKKLRKLHLVSLVQPCCPAGMALRACAFAAGRRPSPRLSELPPRVPDCT